jgi:hypothetical protein
MVPFSFPQPLLKSRVMKKYLTGALDDEINGFWDNWVHGVDHRPSRWDPNGRDGVSPSPYQCCHRKIPMNQIPFQKPNRHPASFIFYPCHPWLKKPAKFQVI